MPGMRIEIPLYDGFDEVDAIAPFEALRNAGLDAVLVGARGPGEVVASHGARLLTDAALSGDADLVLVPGGGWISGGGVRDEYDRGDLPARLRELHDAGTQTASVCTGAMLLAKAGILAGRPAVTHAVALDDLRADGADVRADARVVDDGDVLTAGGVTSGLDLALHLVERLKGAETAEFAARLLEHEPVGKVLTRA